MVAIVALACSETNHQHIGFYHWKSKAKSSEAISKSLTQADSDTIYMHYFDVEAVESHYPYIVPKYVLKEIDEVFKSHEIVPVIFIANNVFRKNIKVEMVALKISALTNEISQHHFGIHSKKIQLDCDWTESTREKYFILIDLMKNHFEVNATIRLHQIKYADKTGVPPVNHGTLMLYNVGDLSDFDTNSILNLETVKSYINNNTSYPVKLNIALPLFSQTVLKNNEGKLKLLNSIYRETLTADSHHFSQLNENVFVVKADTLFHGFFLSKGFQLKLEESSAKSIVESFQVIKNSKLNHSGVVFYHLDEPTLANTNIDSLIHAL